MPPSVIEQLQALDAAIKMQHARGLTVVEIAATLDAAGLRIQHRTITETLVRARLKGLGLTGNRSPLHYQPVQNCFKPRP